MAKLNVTTKWNVLWAQKDGPGTVPQLVSCYTMDSFPIPRGALTPTHCWNPITGTYDVTARMRAPADLPTASLDGLTFKEASWLEKAFRRGCDIYLYVNSYNCPPRTSFTGFDRGYVLKAAMLETETPAGLLQRDDEAPSTHAFDVQMAGVEKYFSLGEYRRTTAEVTIINDLVVVGGPQCQGECGPGKDAGDVMYHVASNAVAVTANVQYSVDGGQTWTNTSADPLAASELGASIVAIPWDTNHWRLIVALGTTRVAGPMVVSYADVDIIAAPATTVWTEVTLGATNGEYALHSGALFAMDRFHIWCVTDQGETYFSSDGGASWAAQGTAALVADELNYVNFISESVGVAVGGSTGASHVCIVTVDGGLHWAARAFVGPGATVMAWSVAVISAKWWHITFEDGSIWMTQDGGYTYVALPVAAPAGYTIPAMLDISAVDECCLWASGMALEGANNYGIILRSVNGGYDWENWLTVVLDDGTTGIKSINPVSYNRAIGVGNLATTAVIYDVTD